MGYDNGESTVSTSNRYTANELLDIFGVCRDEAALMRMKYIEGVFNSIHRDIINEMEKKKTITQRITLLRERSTMLKNIRSKFVASRIMATDKINRSFCGNSILEIDKELRAIDNKIRYLRAEKRGDTKGFVSIDQIKKDVKIPSILALYNIKVERGGFFKLRSERTPSCKFDESKNVYYDFGAAKGGSVIDLYMVIHSCSLQDAIKNLARLV